MSASFTFETFLVITITLMIITTNILILLVACWTDCFKDFNRIYLLSLIIADLCLGLFIAPFAIFTSLYDHWVYSSAKFCHWQAYTITILWIAGFYSLTWLNVDHYVAIRKPQRYNIMMSTQRSICWIGFAWIIAIGFCGPPLFALEDGSKYTSSVFLCLIEAQFQKAYFVTAGSLMIVPPSFALVVTGMYLFTGSFHEKRQVYDKILVEHASRPWNYHICFVLSIVYVFAWFPWCCLQVFDLVMDLNQQTVSKLNFYFLWFAIGNSFYKFFVFLSLIVPFRKSLRLILFRRECPCHVCEQLRGSDSSLSISESTALASHREH